MYAELNSKYFFNHLQYKFMVTLDRQTRMKLEAELAFVNERLLQIRQNRDIHGIDNEEYKTWINKRNEIMSKLY